MEKTTDTISVGQANAEHGVGIAWLIPEAIREQIQASGAAQAGAAAKSQPL